MGQKKPVPQRNAFAKPVEARSEQRLSGFFRDGSGNTGEEDRSSHTVCAIVEGAKIALVEDDPIMGESLVQSLTLEGASVEWFSSGRTALEGLAACDADLVICDIRLSDTDGQRLFREMSQQTALPPFLFMTAFGDIDQAVALMRSGACDYLTKPFDMDTFLERVRGAMKAKTSPGKIMEDYAPPRHDPVLGVSGQIAAVENFLRKIAGLSSSVLITGETGTGKEVCARFLHELGRADTPFMAVNCAAIPADLLESQIFGHEQGAFTGASRRHQGFAERAQNGTLFLDEIGELALPLQAKLLRLIEERTFHRLGGEQQVPFNARLVCATNASLETSVMMKQFRSDLFFRINVLAVEVPPLRQRHADIPWLLDRFFRDFTHEGGTRLRGFSAQAEAAALAHPWPGNVRELRNRVERAVALALGDWIGPADLFPEKAAVVSTPESSNGLLASAKEAAERHQIERVLTANRWHMQKTAAALGISRTTLWEKMRRLRLEKPTADES